MIQRDNQTLRNIQCAIDLRKDTAEMSKRILRKQISSFSRANRPDTSEIHIAPIESHILVYRQEIDKWEGPWTLLEIQGGTCTVIITPPPAHRNFRTTVVNSYIVDKKWRTHRQPTKKALWKWRSRNSAPETTHSKKKMTSLPFID